MKKLSTVGRFFFAIPMMAFGVQHLVYLDFITRIVPGLPPWVPGHALLASIFGLILIAAGIAIMADKEAQMVALLLGGVIFISFTLLYLPPLVTTPPNGTLWTKAGKALGIAGGSFLVAGNLPGRLDLSTNWLNRIVKVLEKFIPAARYFLSYFLILCGILHFIYVDFVVRLVPSWIPGHLFWTYFSGLALIAGGIGICIGLTSRLAAVLTGAMIFLWVVLLHIPRAAADLHDANETTAVFEALAFSGTAFLVATLPQNKA